MQILIACNELTSGGSRAHQGRTSLYDSILYSFLKFSEKIDPNNYCQMIDWRTLIWGWRPHLGSPGSATEQCMCLVATRYSSQWITENTDNVSVRTRAHRVCAG